MDHTELHTRDQKRLRFNHPLLKQVAITSQDVGKLFVLDVKRESGKVMTRDEFNNLPTCQIGGWMEISEFEVNSQ